jgi:deoxyribodipyrimidine photolyase-like uncharacterized protein
LTKSRRSAARSFGAQPERALILVLGDQLSPAVSSLTAGDRDHDVVLMCRFRRIADTHSDAWRTAFR